MVPKVRPMTNMRINLTIAFLLFGLLIFAGPVAAQSGRARGVQTTKPPATNPTNEDGADDSTRNGLGNGESETIEGDLLRVNTSIVTVPVTVMDRYGKAIPNLRRQDFRLFDEGVEQKIAYFAKVDTPFTVALVIDTSNSTHFKLEEIQNAAIAFVNQLQPQDRVLVISFDDQIKVLSQATNDRDALTRAIRRTRTGGGTRLYDAVDMVIQQELQRISGRKAVVLFTDGVDTTSRHATFASTIREAQESEGQVYTVAYDTSDGFGQMPLPGSRGGVSIGWPFPGSGGRGGGNGGSSPADYRRAREYLHQLAQASGGSYFRGDTLYDIAAAFSQVADELRRQYSLGYYPTPVGQPGQRRQIKVRVNEEGIVVKARDSYIYTQKTPNAGGNTQPSAQSAPPSKP
jgi:Ca-activated chloride channel homolog